jgi:hypothetical protein
MLWPRYFLAFLAATFLCGQSMAAQEWHSENGFAGLSSRFLREQNRVQTPFPDETGIHFTNMLDERTGEANRVLFNGSGVAVGDYDNDGLPDCTFAV